MGGQNVFFLNCRIFADENLGEKCFLFCFLFLDLDNPEPDSTSMVEVQQRALPCAMLLYLMFLCQRGNLETHRPGMAVSQHYSLPPGGPSASLDYLFYVIYFMLALFFFRNLSPSSHYL